LQDVENIIFTHLLDFRQRSKIQNLEKIYNHLKYLNKTRYQKTHTLSLVRDMHLKSSGDFGRKYGLDERRWKGTNPTDFNE